MKRKISIALLLCLATMTPAVSAQIKPIIWSESIKQEEKPVTELVNIADHIIVKSDRSIDINLTDKFPITAIDIRRDQSDSQIMPRKEFLFSIRLSDNLAKIINIPFGENKF